MTRREKVLKLIVEHFIKTAQPVSSQVLIDEYGMDYSSATIRSEMFALENEGYLEKTHTSSGRIPSSLGYRYYIEHLRERNVDEEFKYKMQQVLDKRIQSIDDIIQESCEILSEMTSLASISIGSNVSNETLVSVQMIPISETSMTCVFVTDQGYVGNKTFVISKDIKPSDIESCVKLLNDRLKGTKVCELVNKMELVKPLLNDYVVNHDVIYKVMLQALVSFASDRLTSYGKDELFDQPEFANDANKIKKILELLDSPEVFRNLDDGGDEDIQIHIGGESNNKDDDVSIISAKVNIPGSKEGSIAIVGPKRMDYDKVVSNMEYLIKELEKYFAELGSGKDSDEEES